MEIAMKMLDNSGYCYGIHLFYSSPSEFDRISFKPSHKFASDLSFKQHATSSKDEETEAHAGHCFD